MLRNGFASNCNEEESRKVKMEKNENRLAEEELAHELKRSFHTIEIT